MEKGCSPHFNCAISAARVFCLDGGLSYWPCCVYRYVYTHTRFLLLSFHFVLAFIAFKHEHTHFPRILHGPFPLVLPSPSNFLSEPLRQGYFYVGSSISGATALNSSFWSACWRVGINSPACFWRNLATRIRASFWVKTGCTRPCAWLTGALKRAIFFLGFV